MFITSSLFTEVKEMHLVAATGHCQEKSIRKTALEVLIIGYDHVASGKNLDGRVQHYRIEPQNELQFDGSS